MILLQSIHFPSDLHNFFSFLSIQCLHSHPCLEGKFRNLYNHFESPPSLPLYYVLYLQHSASETRKTLSLCYLILQVALCLAIQGHHSSNSPVSSISSLVMHHSPQHTTSAVFPILKKRFPQPYTFLLLEPHPESGPAALSILAHFMSVLCSPHPTATQIYPHRAAEIVLGEMSRYGLVEKTREREIIITLKF